MKNPKKMFKLFSAGSPEIVDDLIEKFLEDGKRKQLEQRHTNVINHVPIKTPLGLHLPAGTQQVELQMLFHCILVFEGNDEDLKNKKQNNNNLEILS